MIYELQVFTRNLFTSGNDILPSGNTFDHNPKETLTLLLDSSDPFLGYYRSDQTAQTVAEFLNLQTGYAEDNLTEGTGVYLGTISIMRTQPFAYESDDTYLVAYLVKADGSTVGYGSTYVILPLNGSPPLTDPTRLYATDYYQNSRTWTMPEHDAGDGAPCFTPGTLIDTPKGPVEVETLRPGDKVMTRDHGAQVLRWRGEKRLSPRMLDLAPNLRPIRIRAGALGPDAPARDLVVSPQHRVLVASRIARRLFGCDEALVAARHLLGLPGIGVERAETGVTYLHLGFDAHEIVKSDGLWTESFYPGAQALDALNSGARREFLALFPQFRHSPPPGARRFLSGREGRNLAARHEKNGRALLESL